MKELGAPCHLQVSEPDLKEEESDAESTGEDTRDDVGKKKGLDKVPRNLGLIVPQLCRFFTSSHVKKKYDYTFM